jgi:hypothetical protein
MEVRILTENKDTDFHDLETQASSPILPLKQSGLKIIIDDFPEENSSSKISKIPKAAIDSILKRIEELKKLSKSNYCR